MFPTFVFFAAAIFFQFFFAHLIGGHSEKATLTDKNSLNGTKSRHFLNSSSVDQSKNPDSKKGLRPTTTMAKKKRKRPLYGLTYSPWRRSRNCSDLTRENIIDDFTLISLLADNVQLRGFDCENVASLILNLSINLNLGLLIGLSAVDEKEFDRQSIILERLIVREDANVSNLLIAVGRMDLDSAKIKESDLIKKLQKLKNMFQNRVNLTTIDRIENLINRSITPYLDVYAVGIDFHKSSSNLGPGASARNLVETVTEIRRKAKIDKKRILITDIGWPSDDRVPNANVNKRLPPAQMEFLVNLICANERLGETAVIDFFLNSAFDSPIDQFSWPDTSTGLATAASRQLKPYVLQTLFWNCARTIGDWESQDSNSSSIDRSAWLWAIALVGLGFAAMFALLIFFWHRKRRAQKKLQTARFHFMQLNSRSGGGEASNSTQQTSAGQSESDGYYLPMIEPHYQDLSALVAPEWRIDLNALELKEIIGKGHFGIVQRANYCRDGLLLDVAVKRLHVGAGDVRQFISEGMRMQILRHQNVLTLVGITFTVTNLPMIVMPFMARGDLHSFLKDETNKVATSQLLNFAQQIADGMRYLHDLKWIHRDLAARNCMLDENLLVKIADFGLCRCVGDSESYHSTQTFELPLKWMAVETLTKLEWTTKTDVWSFGVVLWELMSRGREPYSDVALIELRAFIQHGGRLAKPDGCNELLYDLMKSCWQNDPNDRPDFEQICQILSTLFRRKSVFAQAIDILNPDQSALSPEVNENRRHSAQSAQSRLRAMKKLCPIQRKRD